MLAIGNRWTNRIMEKTPNARNSRSRRLRESILRCDRSLCIARSKDFLTTTSPKLCRFLRAPSARGSIGPDANYGRSSLNLVPMYSIWPRDCRLNSGLPRQLRA